MLKQRCPLLERYFVPRDEGTDLDDWQKEICENCPISRCVEDYKGAIPFKDLSVLYSYHIRCPNSHCRSTDDWEIRSKNEIVCIHCGKSIGRWKRG